MIINALLNKSLKNFSFNFLPIYLTNNYIHFIDVDDYMNYKMASGDNNGSSQPSGGCNGGCLTVIVIVILTYGVLSSIFKS